MHHVFEHFERAEALGLLVRWRDWLAPNGQLVLETPDFEQCVRGFEHRSAVEQTLILRHLYGSQEAPWAKHLDGWSARRFEYILGRLGYQLAGVETGASDPAGLLANVIVSAVRDQSMVDAASAGEELLRLSMNGETAVERELYARWLARYRDTLGAPSLDR